MHGPYMVSKAALEIKQGANVSFDWYASDDQDAYDVYGYLLEVRKHQANIIMRPSLPAWQSSRGLVIAYSLSPFSLHAGQHRQHHYALERVGRLDELDDHHGHGADDRHVQVRLHQVSQYKGWWTIDASDGHICLYLSSRPYSDRIT